MNICYDLQKIVEAMNNVSVHYLQCVHFLSPHTHPHTHTHTYTLYLKRLVQRTAKVLVHVRRYNVYN